MGLKGGDVGVTRLLGCVQKPLLGDLRSACVISGCDWRKLSEVETYYDDISRSQLGRYHFGVKICNSQLAGRYFNLKYRGAN